MAVSRKVDLKKILLGIWKMIQSCISFLTTLIIVISIAITVLFLAKIKPYVVITGSMEPAIPVQSVCFVNERIPLEDVTVGEVISFRMSENMFVTHRVNAISNGQYITKGDANNTEDASPVTTENYIGKTVFVIPKVGYILSFLHTKKEKIVAAAIIVLLLILSFLPKKEKKPETQ